MQTQQAGSTVNPVQARQIIAVTTNWIHVFGSDGSHYLLPTVPQLHSPEHAYADSEFLKSLGISTLEAATLIMTDDLAIEAGLVTDETPWSRGTALIGWRLPEETGNSRLFQVLPSCWLSRITNREQFLEVLILDTWLRRPGRRGVIFKKSGREIQAFFLPSGTPNDLQKSLAGQSSYYQKDVYKGLSWAKIQSVLKAKLMSLKLPNLERALNHLPQIEAKHEVLRAIWSEIVFDTISFDQTFSDVREQIFGRVGYTDEERSIQVRADRVRAQRGTRAGHPLGRGCG